MAAFAKDLISNKCYRQANGGNVDEIKRLLKEEKAKNPKRIPYFFSASKKHPGMFCLGYQPGSKPRIEYVTVTPDGFRYRSQIHDGVNELIKWFKEHYQDPIPRPVQTGSSTSTPASSGYQIPSHITQNLDYTQLQAAVNTATNQRSVTGNTPYTPTHLAYSTGTPTPQYSQQQYGSYTGQQRGVSGRYPGNREHYQFGGGSGSGGSWRSEWGTGGGPHHTASRTPSHQTPGRTPAYTPTQTPHSVSSLYGTPITGGRTGHAHHGSSTPHRRHHMEPPGTPLQDE